MFAHYHPQSRFERSVGFVALVAAATMRKVRSQHRNVLVALTMAILQTLLLLVMFYLMFSVLGMRGMALRGDFVLYLMTGIFLFITFNASMAAVLGSEGPVAPMMLHRPMTTLVAILAAALSTLYVKGLALALVLACYHLGWGPIEIVDPLGALAMLLLTWLAGSAVGLVFLTIKPWAPSLVSIVHQLYSRANMIASGKMFLANSIPAHILPYFAWNPLFHTIDQSRGFTFINYTPHNTSALYPLKVVAVLLLFGMMAEYVTRKNISLSWSAGN